MQLATLPDAQRRLVVVGCSVRKPIDILKPYLESLAWQEKPANVDFHYVFVPDFPTANSETEAYLRHWTAERGGEVLRGGPVAANDFSDAPGLASHQWSSTAMARVGQNKNRILRRAAELKAEAVWLADADLVMDRTTFASLWSVEKPIACAVYWTHWQREKRETARSFAGPQVWLRHPYQQDGRGMDAAEFRTKLVQRSLARVWGQGACTVIRMPVIHAGIDFTHINEPALLQGMMAGEDRHFCIKAERMHIEMWADAWPDIFHIYHSPEDIAQAPAFVTRLGITHPAKPMLGDLVSLRLDPLEPFPQPNGAWHRLGAQWLRGRLGNIHLLPELEEAILGIARGQNATVPVHFPIHWPVPYLRGRRRLIRVEVLDCKPFQFPPVLERELAPKGASFVDTALLTDQQTEAING